MLGRLPGPAIIAHRGASAYAPENTLAAFELAVQQGADAVELDVKLTADRRVVVIHDATVDRTTNGTGRVADLRLAALKELDAGRTGARDPGQKIPTLEEVFEAVGQTVFLNIELTNYQSVADDLPWITAELVQQHGMSGRVLISSFNPLALHRTRKALPGTPTGLLARSGWPGVWARAWARGPCPHQALHPHHSDVTDALVAAVHRRDRRVHAYTVNDRDHIRNMFRLGVDGIFTDDPPLARRLLTTEFS